MLAFSKGSEKNARVKDILHRLIKLRQYCVIGDKDVAAEAVEVVFYTAEAYRLGTIHYVHDRILLNCSDELRHILTPEDVHVVRESLLTILEWLPIEGKWYTSIWPLWVLFIYSVRLSLESDKSRIQDNVWSKLDRNSSRSVSLQLAPAVPLLNSHRMFPPQLKKTGRFLLKHVMSIRRDHHGRPLSKGADNLA